MSDQRDQRVQADEAGNGGQAELMPSMCSICHCDPPINAIQLDCGHIFCYLCIKSASEITGVCALCRREIGIEFNFKEHEILGPVRLPSSPNGFYWFYEGFRGWWLYDAETNCSIEEAYNKNEQIIETFIAGHMYTIDLRNMVQSRMNGDGRIRKICRAKLDLENILGIAGLKGRDSQEMLEMMRSADGIM